MKRKFIKLLACLFFATTLSCSKGLVVQNIGFNEIDNSISVSNNYGATINANFNFGNNFNTKANVNGLPRKTASDINYYQIYLLKTSDKVFPLDGDPLNPSNIIAGPIKSFRSSNIHNNVTFRNVPSSTDSFGTGDYYHIAVQPFDSEGNNILEENNGSDTTWTGVTKNDNKVAVSKGEGIQVLKSDFSLSSSNKLTTDVNLFSFRGVTADVKVNFTGDNFKDVKLLGVNLCTDPTKPFTSKVFANELPIEASVENSTYNFELDNIPSGTYYVTLSAYDSIGFNSNELIKVGNGLETYSELDKNEKIAVSNNKLKINDKLEYSFEIGDSFNVDVNLESSNSLVGE